MKFTKHFYIEGQRIVSKLGDMGKTQDLLNPKDTTRAGNNGNHPIDWDNKNESLKNQLIENFEELGLTGAVFYSPNNYFIGVREPASLGSAGKSGKIPYGQRRSPREHFFKFFMCEQIKKYYRNSNLVGGNSSSFITDASGEAQQHLEYFPFGETFVEEHHGHDRYSNYKFNGKELDEETGLYYYGARYYDPRISMWYGVDRLVEQHPNISSYAYCANNPLILIDPDGMDWIERTKAIARARQYVAKNPTQSNSLYGYPGYHSGTPGKKTDCSNLVSESANASGFGHLNNTATDKYSGKETGVKNIINQKGTRKVDSNNIIEGNIFSIDNDGHTGFVADIIKDDKGNVTSFNIIHSKGSKGPVEQNIDLNDPEDKYAQKYFADGKADFYAWDTPDRVSSQGTISQQSISQQLKGSNVPILKTVGEILNAFGL